MPDVKDYEPPLALDGGTHGIVFYDTILKKFTHQLKENGLIAFEIGYDIKEDVIRLFNENGNFSKIEVIADLSGVERVIIAQK